MKTKNKKYLLDTNILIDFMIIASQAISEGLTVVTDNLKHFENMPDVKTENWMVH